MTDEFLKKKMMNDYSYPKYDDVNIQKMLYEKREFLPYKLKKRKEINTYEEKKKYIDSICNPKKLELHEQQILLSNFLNPDTPYKGCLLFHGVGSGKTCASIAIAEKFKDLLDKYELKITILVPGPLNKQQYLNEIIKCTGNTYLNVDKTNTILYNMAKNEALKIISKYYNIMSYSSFRKKTLGDKIKDDVENEYGKKIIRKTNDGKIERRINVNSIDVLDNTLLIVDEAHNLTGKDGNLNDQGNAVKQIIEKSKNLKVLFLSATPIKNNADDIIGLLNLIRPENDKIKRNKIFTQDTGHRMKLKENGLEYFRNKVRGLVSYLKGADPLTYAQKVDMGINITDLKFTKIIPCYMDEFQMQTYEKYKISINVDDEQTDTLYKNANAISNIAFPILDDNDNLTNTYSNEGVSILINQLKSNKKKLNKIIVEQLFKNKVDENDKNEMFKIVDGKNQITGNIFKEKYLKKISTKFHQALINLNKNVQGVEGPGILFVYCNLVTVGINIFKQILIENGYVEYNEMEEYEIKPNMICYKCGIRFDKHDNEHKFSPSVIYSVIGKHEDAEDDTPIEKMKIIDEVVNNSSNKDGNRIKIIMGSKVLNEGITLHNIKEVHILDVHYNLGKIDQVIGRAIRWCKHYELISEQNQTPQVKVYKYAILMKNEISTDIQLYKNAELKYIMVKKLEHIMKETAFDCPLVYNANMLPEDIDNLKNETFKKDPSHICNYIDCFYKCDNKILNDLYFNDKKYEYDDVPKNKIDYTTFNEKLINNEINYIKEIIKQLYIYKYVYTLDELIKMINMKIDNTKFIDLYETDNFPKNLYIYMALHAFIPSNNYEHNTLTNILYDKYNNDGYLIKRGKYYIFHPFSQQNENISMFHRKQQKIELKNTITLDYYLQTKNIIKKQDIQKTEEIIVNEEYYNNYDDFTFVGSIIGNIFRIRPGNKKDNIDKNELKRGTGIFTFQGQVCVTKNIEQLNEITNVLNIKISKEHYRNKKKICVLIKDKMLLLEKYSSVEDKNRKNYVIIPSNHETLEFPYNLEDRVKFKLKELVEKTDENIKYTVGAKKELDSKNGINIRKYKIIIKKDDNTKKYENIFKNIGYYLDGDKYVLKVE